MVDETGLADVTAANGDHIDGDVIDDEISHFPLFEGNRKDLISILFRKLTSLHFYKGCYNYSSSCDGLFLDKKT